MKSDDDIFNYGGGLSKLTLCDPRFTHNFPYEIASLISPLLLYHHFLGLKYNPLKFNQCEIISYHITIVFKHIFHDYDKY